MITFVHNLFRMHACTYFSDHFKENKFVLSVESSKAVVVGFLGYPQPGGGTHPPIPREGVLGEVLGDWDDLALR